MLLLNAVHKIPAVRISMGVQERKAREKEELRQEILDAARELFIEQGYDFGTKSIGSMQIEVWKPEMLMGIGMTMLCLELLSYTVVALVGALWPNGGAT